MATTLAGLPWLGIERPIVQAPMAGSQGSALAIAVCRAGGLGSLPCAMLAPEAVEREIGAIRAATESRFNLNFFCHRPPAVDPAREQAWLAALAPYYRELGLDPAAVTPGPGRRPFDAESAALIEALRPPVVSFHFGLPDADLLDRVRRSGARILASATTVEEGRWLDARGVDAVIAQGLEAGGHRGHFLSDDLSRQLGTLALVRQLVRAVRAPVIAAGGIGDAEGVRAALALGAAAAQVGTAYLLTPEATTAPLHRAALQSEAAAHTALTNLWTGRPARGIVNRLMRELGPISAAAPAFPLATAAMAPLRAAGEARRVDDFSPLWCGQHLGPHGAIGAAELTHALAA